MSEHEHQLTLSMLPYIHSTRTCAAFFQWEIEQMPLRGGRERALPPLDVRRTWSVRLTTYYVRLWHIEESEEGVREKREGDEEGEWENGEGTNG